MHCTLVSQIETVAKTFAWLLKHSVCLTVRIFFWSLEAWCETPRLSKNILIMSTTLISRTNNIKVLRSSPKWNTLTCRVAHHIIVSKPLNDVRFNCVCENVKPLGTYQFWSWRKFSLFYSKSTFIPKSRLYSRVLHFLPGSVPLKRRKVQFSCGVWCFFLIRGEAEVKNHTKMWLFIFIPSFVMCFTRCDFPKPILLFCLVTFETKNNIGPVPLHCIRVHNLHRKCAQQFEF